MMGMSNRKMEVRLVAGNVAEERDLPALVTVLIGGQIFECQFRHYSIAKAVVARIAREHNLRLSKGVWRSRE
jgi:hypothetical protein